MNKPSTYIFLPTDKGQGGYNLYKDLKTGKIIYSGGFYLDKLQHLYILSEDEIKGDDFFIWDKEVKKCQYTVGVHEGPSGYSVYDDKDRQYFSFNCKKIIATTNPELCQKVNLKTEGDAYIPDVSKISQSDIEHIISLYNGKGKEVDNIEDRKIVAAQQYALSKCGVNELSSLNKVKLAWENGFETCQSLSDNKMFTLEDMNEAIRFAQVVRLKTNQKEGENPIEFINSEKEIIQSFENKIKFLTKEPKRDIIMVSYKKGISNEIYTPVIQDGCIVIIK